MSESGMWMGHEPWDIEAARQSVGPGWHSLLPAIFSAAEKHQVSIDQVKEKLGRLRVYAGRHSGNRGSVAWEAVDRVIQEASRRSGEICEVCGRPGRTWDSEPPPGVEGDWWIKTLCDPHTLEYYVHGRRDLWELGGHPTPE